MSEFLDLEGLKSYHAKLPALIASIKGESSVTSFNTRTGDVTPQDGDYNAYMVGAVPNTRTVNGKQLNANITLTKDDIEGLEDLAAPDLSGYVPTSRTVNGKSLRSNISLSATDVGAVPSSTSLVGKSMAGKSVKPTSDTTVTAGEGAEIFNDYRARVYNPTVSTGNIASGKYSHAEGRCTTANGDASHAEGAHTKASASSSHASGSYTIASGPASHAEGQQSEAAGGASHAEGYNTMAAESYTHAEGDSANAMGYGCHAEGRSTYANGQYSHAEGLGVFSDDDIGGAHAEGTNSIATSNSNFLPLKSYAGAAITVDTSSSAYSESLFSKITSGTRILIWNFYYTNSTYSEYTVSSVNSADHTITLTDSLPSSSFRLGYAVVLGITVDGATAVHAEGYHTVAIGSASHSEGATTMASGPYSHAEGYTCRATGSASHAEGQNSLAEGAYSHAEGMNCVAYGIGAHANGSYAIASANAQTAIGKYNVKSNAETDKFIIGKGSSATSRSNCLRVTDTGVYATGAYRSSGADYAELFEWMDGNQDNEDRRGLFVTLDGEYIRLANSDDDFILGIISANPSVIGDVHDDQWQGMYLYDIYGTPIWEDVEVPDETVEEPDPEDPEKMITRVIIPAHTEHRQKLNPDYDNTQTYIPRTRRKEWACVGMMGKLVVRDDGSCEVNGYAKVAENGKATRSYNKTKYRVMSRIDETHIRALILANY